MLPAAGRHYSSIFTSRKKCGVYSKFREFLKVTIAGPSSNSSNGRENNNELYGFSAVKMKLVDCLI